MEIKLLPIGTIVMLKDSEPKVMITGYCPIGESRPGYVWDYSGLIFPRGYKDANQILQFDKEQIDYVVAMGYQDEEQFAFIRNLDEVIEDLKQAVYNEAEKLMEMSEEDEENV
ncbi:MAG: DUF4176 domain-containing protein [Lachnospiraceae bacterium]|nr:DUF4176 domain-containing protein [Lachnospiraceae bacterium]